MKELIYTLWMLVGTYTGGESEGIYVYGFDPETAKIEYVGMTPVDNPSYLATSEDGRFVYAVSENDGSVASLANAFEFNPASGELTFVNSVETSGAAPCNIATNGRLVVTANYAGGDISTFRIRGGGALSPLKQTLRLPWAGEDGVRSDSNGESHMHCVKFSPDGRYLFAADLGTDKLLRWDVRSGRQIDTGSLKTFDLPEGSGPRHFVFDNTGKNLYLINELSGTVIAFRYNGGEITLFQTIQADTVHGRGSADIVLTPDGQHLYTSHRLKNDGVAIFSVSPGDGTISLSGYKNTGIHPRNLSITPDGRFLAVASRDSGTVEFFSINPSSGALSPTGRTTGLDKPVCVLFLSAK